MPSGQPSRRASSPTCSGRDGGAGQRSRGGDVSGECVVANSQSVLVYSKYRHDLPKFEKLLSQALPDIEVNYADTPENAERYFAAATVLYGWGFPAAWLSRMPRLQWVQKMGAGVDDIIGAWPIDRDILLTRTDGRLIATRMAEYVLAMILDHNLQLDHARRLQAGRA